MQPQFCYHSASPNKQVGKGHECCITNFILGKVEGFVDLGKFTREEDKATTADHGMVMLFQPFQGEKYYVIRLLCIDGPSMIECFLSKNRMIEYFLFENP